MLITQPLSTETNLRLLFRERSRLTDQTSAESRLLFSEDYTTRGTLVRGLTYNDVNALDIFEGTASLTLLELELG